MKNLSNFEKEAEKIKLWLESELSAVRTGRATPALLKNIGVEYYGTRTKLEGLASIFAQDAKTLIVQPWEKGSFEAIEKAIRSSNTGFQPVVDKEVIRIILPELTGERRQALSKLVGEKTEEARIALRQTRDEVWKEIQEAERKKEISEDEKFRDKNDLQKKVDKFNSEFGAIAEKKRIEIGS